MGVKKKMLEVNDVKLRTKDNTAKRQTRATVEEDMPRKQVINTVSVNCSQLANLDNPVHLRVASPGEAASVRSWSSPARHIFPAVDWVHFAQPEWSDTG